MLATTKIIKIYQCKWCGTKFIKNHNRQVYCTEYCSKESRKEKTRADRIKHYKTYKKINKVQTYAQYKKDLGTGSLSMHPNPDYTIELSLIRKEKVRLKI